MTTSPCVLPVPLRPHSQGLGIVIDHHKKISYALLVLPIYRPTKDTTWTSKGLIILDNCIRLSHRSSVHSAPCLKIELMGFNSKMADIHPFSFLISKPVDCWALITDEYETYRFESGSFMTLYPSKLKVSDCTRIIYLHYRYEESA